MDIVLKPSKITSLFALTAAGLVFMHLVCQLVYFFVSTDNWLVQGFLEEFHLSREGNLPTYYSAVALLFCSVLLAFIARSRKREPYSAHWAGLAAVFLFLSLDEMLQWHEILVNPVRATLDTSGLLYFAWVIPYGLLLLTLLVLYTRFIFYHLPNRTRGLFVLAGLMFVSGAIGVEMLGGRHAELYGDQNLTMVLYQTVEESLEIMGILVFIYALTSYIATDLSGARLSIKPSGLKPRNTKPSHSDV